MIISCPQCATSFRADGSKIAPAGTKVRCAKCGHVWVQKPEAAAPASAPAPAPVKVTPKPAPKPEVAPAPPPPPPIVEPPMPVFEATPVRMPMPPVIDEEPPAPEEEEAESRADKRRREREERALKLAEREQSRALAKPRRKSGGILSLLGWILFVGVVGGALFALVSQRTKIVAFWPQTATLYKMAGMPVNLAGLDLRNISYERVFEDGVPVLELHGEILNTGKQTVVVPKLRAALLSDKGAELYFWTFPSAATRLGPKETSAFSSRLPSPPVDSRELAVTFAMGE